MSKENNTVVTVTLTAQGYAQAKKGKSRFYVVKFPDIMWKGQQWSGEIVSVFADTPEAALIKCAAKNGKNYGETVTAEVFERT